MKKSYQQIMNQIHAPEDLNKRVLYESRNIKTRAKEHRKGAWLKPAVCFACVLALLMGGALIYPDDSSVPDFEDAPLEVSFSGLMMTAAAADLPGVNDNGGLGIELAGDNHGGCLFRIQGSGIERIALTINGGAIYHEGTSEKLTTIDEEYIDGSNYGVFLTEDMGTLKITINGKETFQYLLTQENLRLSQSEDGKVTLVPLLNGDPSATTKGIYAVNSDKCRWFTWPVEGAYTIDISMPYGPTPNGRFHAGIDIPAEIGTPIIAAADGKIAETGFDPKRGYYVMVDHGDGLLTCYDHCKQVIAKDGTEVKAGDTIALVGKTGMATGAFLHFEIRQDGVAQDPTTYFDAKIREQLIMA